MERGGGHFSEHPSLKAVNCPDAKYEVGLKNGKSSTIYVT
jgi:hypothetical protein